MQGETYSKEIDKEKDTWWKIHLLSSFLLFLQKLCYKKVENIFENIVYFFAIHKK